MQTAPNPKSAGSNVRRAWHTGANSAAGNAGGHPVPHVLLRLPRIGDDEPLNSESPAAAKLDRMSVRLDPPAARPYAGLHRDFASRDRIAPGPLTDFNGWLAGGGKVWLTIVALLVANGAVLLWRQSPAPQAVMPFSPTADDEHSALKPVPLDDTTTTSDQTATVESPLPSKRSIGEPTLAPPQPQPDSFNSPVVDEPVVEAVPLRQEPTLAPPRPDPTLAKREPTLAPKREALEPVAESPVATSESTPPSAGKQTATEPAPAVKAAEPPKQDIPPWQKWDDDQPHVTQQTPSATSTEPQPTLAPPKESVQANAPSPEPRTAAVTQASPTLATGAKPRSMAKLKGTINKPLSEPGHEHTRRSLY